MILALEAKLRETPGFRRSRSATRASSAGTSRSRARTRRKRPTLFAANRRWPVASATPTTSSTICRIASSTPRSSTASARTSSTPRSCARPASTATRIRKLAARLAEWDVYAALAEVGAPPRLRAARRRRRLRPSTSKTAATRSSRSWPLQANSFRTTCTSTPRASGCGSSPGPTWPANRRSCVRWRSS